MSLEKEIIKRIRSIEQVLGIEYNPEKDKEERKKQLHTPKINGTLDSITKTLTK